MQQSRRVASSTGSRSGSSGSGDGVGVSSASGSTSGGSSDSRVWSDETCACTSFEEEEEKEQGDGPLADGLHAGKAKIEKVGDGDDDNDDGACESPNGDEDDLDDSANTGIDRRRHHIDGRANQGAETAMVTLSSQLIRSVEVDSTCCWNGAAGDQPLTDVRIVMVIDSKPDTRLLLLKMDEEVVKTASFYSIQKMPSERTELFPTEEDALVTPRQNSAPLGVSERTNPRVRFEKRDIHRHSCAQSSDDEDPPSFKKRRLFPILRSSASVGEIYKAADDASSEPRNLGRRLWPAAAPTEIEGFPLQNRDWIQKWASAGKESRSTSGHTVQIHSRSTSASCSSSSALWESFSSSTAERLGIKREHGNRPLSHRHCEACKRGRHGMPSGSSAGLPIATKATDVKANSVDENHRGACQTCYHLDEPKELLEIELAMYAEKQIETATKAKEIKHDKRDGYVEKCKNLAPYKMKLRGFNRNKHFPHDLSISALKGNLSELISVADQYDERPRVAGYDYYTKLISSSDVQKSFQVPTNNQKNQNVGHSQGRRSSVNREPHNENGRQSELQSPNPSKVQEQRQTRRSSSTLSSNMSSKVSVRSEAAGSAHPLFKEPSGSDLETDPVLIKDDSKLEIYFADDVASGIYLIELEATVALSSPDSRGWRDFCIPGLLPVQRLEVPVCISFHVHSISPLSPSQSEESQVGGNSARPWIPKAQFNTDQLLDVGVRTPTQVSGKFLLGIPLILKLRLKIPLCELDHWDTSISFRTFPQLSERHGLLMEHHASLTIITATQELFAEQIRYSYLVKNGFGDARTYTLNRDECLIELGNINWQDISTHHPVELTVIRHLEDLGKPLELSFALYYPKTDQRTIRLPTMCPKTGSVLSERVMIVQPPPPLTAEYPESDSFSTWKPVDLPEEESQSTYFDRCDLPKFFPERLKDDLVIKIIEPPPVCYRALQREGNPLISEEPSNLIWNLKMNIDKIFNDGLECTMKFDTQAGCSDQVLIINPQDWTPDLFTIGGRVATPAIGEWRKDRNGYLTLLKLPEMNAGQTLKIMLRWYKMIVREKSRPDDPGQSQIEYSLPKINDKSILGGCLRCNVDAAIYISRNGISRDTPWQVSGDSSAKQIRLPKMFSGYTMGMSLTGVPGQPARSIRFKDEQQPKEICADSIRSEKHESRFEKQGASGPLPPRRIIHHDLHTSSTSNPRSRVKVLSWAQYISDLAWSLLRHVLTPVLLICAFQSVVSRITHAWRPVDVTGFPPVKARHDPISGFRSIFNFGSLAVPWVRPESDDRTGPRMESSETKEPLAKKMPENSLDLERVDDRESTTSIESPEDPGHGDPAAEGTSVMDWIDRALGWKNFTH